MGDPLSFKFLLLSSYMETKNIYLTTRIIYTYYRDTIKFIVKHVGNNNYILVKITHILFKLTNILVYKTIHFVRHYINHNFLFFHVAALLENELNIQVNKLGSYYYFTIHFFLSNFVIFFKHPLLRSLRINE